MRSGICAAGLALAVLTHPGAAVAFAAPAGGAVATTERFAFYSDFETNLNDALIEAGRARGRDRPELFHDGAEADCFEGLRSSARTAWDLAVDYYAAAISPADWTDRRQLPLRLELAGLGEPVDDPEDRAFLKIARGFRQAAAPAYEACRWPAQDGENRRWIEELIATLNVHGAAIARELQQLYRTPWSGLPVRVDVVETVNWAGANTTVEPQHIQISNEAEQPLVALELVFHEASHLLMRREAPVRQALAEAAASASAELPGDLWHAVLFYTTGEAVRRQLARAGEPDYVPLMFDGGIFERYHAALEAAWRGCVDGERPLAAAAAALIRALPVADE
jgi:hypothetical protein